MNVNQNKPIFCLYFFVYLKIVTPVCIWQLKVIGFLIPCIIVFTSKILKPFYMFLIWQWIVFLFCQPIVFLFDLELCKTLVFDFFSLHFVFSYWKFSFRSNLQFECFAFYHGLCFVQELNFSSVSIWILPWISLFFRMLYCSDPCFSMLFLTETWTTKLYEVFWPETT